MALFLMNLLGEGPRNDLGAGALVLRQIPTVTFNGGINLFTNAESVWSMVPVLSSGAPVFPL